ncbi:DinB family protein [Hymenobacter metallilatus]|uniref:DinB family protein n=1 Tax=Hymenobacter metallilatus TaxID=2493666 RepID=A0A428JDQ6_9BACT|nr:DinB family protein [Hymenobacter metallilatus]RSK30260.1 DinB family protein [Hymenobacter metallilatus]
MDQTTKQGVINELISLLTQGNAHVTFEEACAGLTPAQWNQPVPEASHTIWQVVEHLRIAQWDILEFSRGVGHVSPDWPSGYWPATTATANEATWQHTHHQIQADRQRFIGLLHHPATDLLAPIPHGDGQTMLREAMLIADHNAYHTGEIVLLRRLLRAWK